jgi:hypothetical protein
MLTRYDKICSPYDNQGMCLALLNSIVSACSRVKPLTCILLPKSGMQATLLTRSGIYAISDLPEDVVKSAAGLMTVLIRRAK